MPAVVVLGCRASRGGEPTAALARRIALGAALQTPGEPIVAAGGTRWGRRSEAEVIASELVRAGVPAGDVLLELRSLSTIENAHYTAALLQRRGIERVVLATCGWHLPRALTAFRRCGLKAEAPPAALLRSPAATHAERLREAVCAWADSCMMARR